MKTQTRTIISGLALLGFFLVVLTFGGVINTNTFTNNAENNGSLTAFVTYSSNSTNSTESNISSVSVPTQITFEQATNLIEQAKSEIAIMNASNLSTIKVGDLLIDAEKAIKIAGYASILRNEVNASEAQKSEARAALNLISWNKANYSDVAVVVDEIRARKEEAFLLSDKINIKENELSSVDSSIISVETGQLFNNAKTAFFEERYNDTELLLNDFQISFEKDQEKYSTLSGIKNGTKNFVQRYWVGILVFLVILWWISQIMFKKYKIRSIRNKIKKMKLETIALEEMTRKTQTERFKENKISALIYNIRMKKYQERANNIKETLPVLEEELKNLLN